MTCLTALFLASIDTPVWAESKNFYFPEVRIEVNINRDGSFVVDEYRTYEFRGSFSWATLWIPLQVNREGRSYDATIEDFHISDEQDNPLRIETSTSEEKFQAKWFYSARNTRRTFHLHYRIRGGIFSYLDVSELYWQIIGDSWDKPTQKAIINVCLPEEVKSREDILVYGHGPLSGWAEIADLKTARFTVSNLASRQYLEIRIVWPAGMVTGVPSNFNARDSIRAQEALFVQETIERAKRAQEEAQRAEEARERNLKRFLFFVKVWAIWLAVGPLIWLISYLHFWKRVGKDHHFEDIPRYYPEIPSKLSPALVEVLLREGGAVTPRSFTATLFDLAQRGYLEIEDRKEEKRGLFGHKEDVLTTVTLKKDFLNDSTLLPFESEFLLFYLSQWQSRKERKGRSLALTTLRLISRNTPRASKHGTETG